ncbi:metal-sensing transcriptional repressor [Megasphaera vaginalis (ex Bordigoni et al. 2020)]|uniref:metal-sensing transcriptional repressor n=1 Tax=Megasphaera vaginalis (ex Bordigoni et al. 2020) TaxID=2045301 RepID=UPI000C7A1AC8|nr:metal-sensing transcriptional repressor [Megasphaera vaginalis (ex Bordigoni et al. 2020)]
MDKEHMFFDNYAANWDRDRKEDAALIGRLLDLADIPAAAVVLDVGCGTGVLLPYLHARLGGGRIDALDYSKAMLTKAKEKYGALEGISFIEKDILKYDVPPGTYDTVLCFDFYPHMSKNTHRFIKQIGSAVRDGGDLIIMHDQGRQKVNAMNPGHLAEGEAALPAIDVMSTLLTGAGFVVTAAVDDGTIYFVKARRCLELSVPTAAGDQPQSAHCGRYHQQEKIVINRLARISGHLEAVKRMIEGGRDCSDVLIQLAAVDSAVVSVSKVILKDHIDHCLVEAVKQNDLGAVERLKQAITIFVK